MANVILGGTTEENDLGVTFVADTNVSEQCGVALLKGNTIIGLIRRRTYISQTENKEKLFKN